MGKHNPKKFYIKKESLFEYIHWKQICTSKHFYRPLLLLIRISTIQVNIITMWLDTYQTKENASVNLLFLNVAHVNRCLSVSGCTFFVLWDALKTPFQSSILGNLFFFQRFQCILIFISNLWIMLLFQLNLERRL